MTVSTPPASMRNGRFRIDRPLSQGGMGTLYLATETIATGTRKVVIKELLDYYDANNPLEEAKAKERFESEAVTLANLSIPGIPQIFDYFSEGGRNYIVMQFIEGQNLESGLSHVDENGQMYKGKAYAVEQVRRWGIELCKVLANLATQDVIHLDIKPANLIVDKSGAVWLVDFGTAKAHQSGMQSSGLHGSGRTKKSSVFGTIGYAAPEQSAGKPESRSDVYALAATMYHLATDDDPGNHPGQFPKLSKLPADFGGALRAALTSDVSQRIRSQEFRQLLEPRLTRPLGFHWQDGTVSQEPIELARAGNQRWSEARQYFSGDVMEKWFKDQYRHDIAAQLGQIKKQTADQDQGLDAFFRLLDPSLPASHLVLGAQVLDAGTVAWGEMQVVELEIRNTGAGCLQASFTSLPAGIKATQDVLSVPRLEIVKLVVNTALLTPSSSYQYLPVMVEAGSAGSAQARIRIRIPQPRWSVTPQELILGAVYRGQGLEELLIVRNEGSSSFKARAEASGNGIEVQPEKFDCPPGREQRLSVRFDSNGLAFGWRTELVKVTTQAGAWEESLEVPVEIGVSLWKTFMKFGLPVVLWTIAWGIYGGLSGWFMAGMAGGSGGATNWLVGAISGAFLGLALCVAPGMVLGVMGLLDAPAGRPGLRRGLLIGLGVGCLAGAAFGALAGWREASYAILGVWSGGLTTMVFGLVVRREGAKRNHGDTKE